MRRLPPLNALRAFEAVARLGTLGRAAEELFVTPTAVGRHVRNLEETLGAQLFERESGQLALTARGRDYARAIGRALELMLDATDIVLDRTRRTTVTLRAYTTFLVRWLIPRLPAFQLAHPEVDLRLTTAFDAIDFERDKADIGIRYGNGGWPGLESVPLFRDEMVVFGNAAMRERFDGVPIDEAIASSTLLVHSLRLDDWPDWLEAADLAAVIPERQVRLDDMALIYQGALDGLGIGLSQSRYLAQDLALGRLHLLSPLVLRRDRGFHLVCLPETRRKPAVEAFLDWIAEAMRADNDAPVDQA